MNHPQSPQWNTFFIYSTDLGEWPTNMNNEAKDHWIRKGSSTCQLKDLSFEALVVPQTDRESGFRTFSGGLFTCSHVSGSIAEWDWHCYSKTQGKVYCFYCKLFGTCQNSFITGFNDWKHASEYIDSHQIILILLEYSCRNQLKKT